MPKFRECIRRMNPYKPPLEGRSSQDYLLLDFNEMTTEISPAVRQALIDFINSGRVPRYPEYSDIDAKVAEYAGVDPDQVMITNGSDQGIDVIFRAFVADGDGVIIPTPSFAMFYQCAGIQGAEIIEPVYRSERTGACSRLFMSFPLEEVLDAIDSETRLIVVCNPNNPTGTPVDLDTLRLILEKAAKYGAAVLHDEAYFEFSGTTAKGMIGEFDNLFITRTFSKQFGLAALRAGYVISAAENIEQLLKIRGPYDVNMLAKTAIAAVLEDVSPMLRYTKEVMNESKPRLMRFFEENGIEHWDTAANFILIRPDDPKGLLEHLRSRRILVRPRHGPNIEGTLRVSIGTMADTMAFIKACEEYLRKSE